MLSHQILWLVGKGHVVPNREKIRSDTPPALRRLLENCIQHNRELRPLFPQVLAAVESLMRSLPKIHHSLSEPILHRSNLFSKELGEGTSGGGGGGGGGTGGGGGGECSSPKTPGAPDVGNISHML